MTRYALTDTPNAVLRDDGSWIPADPKNPDYRDYLAWRAAGGMPDPYLAPPPSDPMDAWDVISLKIAFNHENRLRVLEGKAVITLAQFRAAVKAQVSP